MDKAADVYSFAIIMWELLTWQQPYKDMMSIQVMYNAVTQHQRPSVPALDDLPGNPGAAGGAAMCACWCHIALASAATMHLHLHTRAAWLP